MSDKTIRYQRALIRLLFLELRGAELAAWQPFGCHVASDRDIPSEHQRRSRPGMALPTAYSESHGCRCDRP